MPRRCAAQGCNRMTMFGKCNKHHHTERADTSTVVVWGEDTIKEVDILDVEKGLTESYRRRARKQERLRRNAPIYFAALLSVLGLMVYSVAAFVQGLI